MSDSTVPSRRLGHHLRESRQATGISIAKAAELIQVGPTTLQRLEVGTAKRIRIVDVQELCRIYGAPAKTTRALIGLAQEAVAGGWWHEYGALIPEDFDVYIGLEAYATGLVIYQAELVPGLFQTADYYRALNLIGYPDETKAAHDQRIEIRERRQAIVTRRRKPVEVNVVINEAALRRVVGSPKIMAAQLRKLADLSTLSNVTLRILPFRAGFPLGTTANPFVILEFGLDHNGKEVEPTVVYLENLAGDLYLDKQQVVQKYHRAHEELQRAALDPNTSRTLLRQVAKEYLT